MRVFFTASLWAIIATAAVAQESVDREALIAKVIDGFKENDRRVGPMKAWLRMTVLSSFKAEQADPIALPPQPALRGPPGVPVDTRSVLVIDRKPKFVIEWTAEIAGEDRRFDVQHPERSVLSLDATGVTEYEPVRQRTIRRPYDQTNLRAWLQYDPREIGFLTLGERLLQFHRNGDIETAKEVQQPGGGSIVELRVKETPAGAIAIECSSAKNFLPTRVIYFRMDGNINAVTDLVYQQVRDDPKPAWFLKSAVRRFATHHKNKSTEEKQWGQTATTEVIKLEELTKLELDAVAPPPPDNDRGTRRRSVDNSPPDD
jgi:hypothetical protein